MGCDADDNDHDEVSIHISHDAIFKNGNDIIYSSDYGLIDKKKTYPH